MFLQVAILPENGEDVIRRAADVLGYPLDTVIQLSIAEGSQSSLAAPFTSEHSQSPPSFACPAVYAMHNDTHHVFSMCHMTAVIVRLMSRFCVMISRGSRTPGWHILQHHSCYLDW